MEDASRSIIRPKPELEAEADLQGQRHEAGLSEWVTNADDSEVAPGKFVNRERASMRSDVDVRSVQSPAVCFSQSTIGVLCLRQRLRTILKVDESGLGLVGAVFEYVCLHFFLPGKRPSSQNDGRPLTLALFPRNIGTNPIFHGLSGTCKLRSCVTENQEQVTSGVSGLRRTNCGQRRKVSG